MKREYFACQLFAFWTFFVFLVFIYKTTFRSLDSVSVLRKMLGPNEWPNSYFLLSKNGESPVSETLFLNKAPDGGILSRRSINIFIFSCHKNWDLTYLSL
jgi:hypothetical protein